MDSPDPTSIFGKHHQLTYKDVKDCIPPDAQTRPDSSKKWIELGKMEWRWRFLTLPGERKVVEISRISSFSPRREFIKENGNWVVRDLPSIFDDYVTEEYYYYTDLD